jgi:hypothetical protein
MAKTNSGKKIIHVPSFTKTSTKGKKFKVKRSTRSTPSKKHPT